VIAADLATAAAGLFVGVFLISVGMSLDIVRKPGEIHREFLLAVADPSPKT
jgi:Kef-type K+ transport system membrane component KefB